MHISSFLLFRLFLAVAMILSSAAACTTVSLAQTTGTVKIVMRGMRSNAGLMRVALFSEHNVFPSDKPMFGATAAIQNKEATCEFNNVPFGHYAVSVFHDENTNEKLDVSIFGPIEQYGFSNGARGIFGPPSFDKAKTSFHEAHKTYIVEVK